MKKSLFTTLLAFFVLPLLGQELYIGPFHSDHTGDPQVHGSGIFQFFIQSDNQLRWGNTERAVLLLDNAIAQNPFFVEAYLKRAKVLTRLGRTEEAKRDLAFARRINPHLTNLLQANTGFSKLNLIDFDPANYQELIQNKFSTETRSLVLSSMEKKVAGDINGSLIDLKRAFDQVNRPESLLYYLKGNLNLIMEDYQSAIANYTRAIELAPDVTTYYFNRGIARLFTYNRNGACNDLSRSERMGDERSREKRKYFCFN